MHIQLFWFHAVSNWLKISCQMQLDFVPYLFRLTKLFGINKWKKNNEKMTITLGIKHLDFMRVLK